MSEFKDSIRQASWATRLLMDALAPVASALGYRRRLAPYLLSARSRSGGSTVGA
jgi:hypothetical protein